MSDQVNTSLSLLEKAQELADQHIQTAEAEKERILNDARNEAEEVRQATTVEANNILAEAGVEKEKLSKEVEELRDKINRLQEFEEIYRSELISFLEEGLSLLGGTEEPQGEALFEEEVVKSEEETPALEEEVVENDEDGQTPEEEAPEENKNEEN